MFIFFIKLIGNTFLPMSRIKEPHTSKERDWDWGNDSYLKGASHSNANRLVVKSRIKNTNPSIE